MVTSWSEPFLRRRLKKWINCCMYNLRQLYYSLVSLDVGSCLPGPQPTMGTYEKRWFLGLWIYDSTLLGLRFRNLNFKSSSCFRNTCMDTQVSSNDFLCWMSTLSCNLLPLSAGRTSGLLLTSRIGPSWWDVIHMMMLYYTLHFRRRENSPWW